MRLIKKNPAAVLTIVVVFLAVCAFWYFVARDFSGKAIYHSDKFSTVIDQKGNAVMAQFSSGGSQIMFALADQGENVSIDYEIKKDGREQGLKETITLKNKKAPHEFMFSLELKDVKNFAQRPDRSWRFYNNSGKEVFYIPAGFMVDAKGARSEDVQIAITQNGADYALKVTADPEWLNDPSRAWPVEIDPSVILSDGFTETGTADLPQEPPTHVTETLLNWRPAEVGPVYKTQLVTDVADFDVDPVTGDHYNRIIQIVVNSPRGGRFGWGAKSRLKSEEIFTGPQSNRVIPVEGRVTTEGFSWDFTPTHVDVRPGSVSNPSLLTSGGNTTIGTSDTTAAFTPTANSLLVVAWSSNQGAPRAHTFTNTHAGSGAWAQIDKDGDATGNIHSQARCQMGASPGSGTVTSSYGANQPSRTSWIVAEITGHHTTTPLSESNTGGAASGTSLSIALVGIAAGNLVIGTMVARDTAAVTPGTNETELAEASSGDTVQRRTQMEYGTDTTVDWSWAASNENFGVAIEYAQAAAAAGTSVKIQGGTKIQGGAKLQ